jgi:hypothetical protein
MARLGSISPKAQSRLNGKLAVLRKTRAQKTRMAAFDGKAKDEGSTKGEIPVTEINHPTNQAKKMGNPSKGGRAGGERQFRSNQINDKSLQSKKWVPGSDVSSRNPATGNTRMKGHIPAQGGQYGGGGRNTQ